MGYLRTVPDLRRICADLKGLLRGLIGLRNLVPKETGQFVNRLVDVRHYEQLIVAVTHVHPGRVR